MKLLVIDRKTLVTFRALDFAHADKIASTDALGTEAIEWAIEEYGRCDGVDYTIIPEEDAGVVYTQVER
jgi:hypothetical protein